ncbi:hypothetical protein V7S43_003459 [Phytophthora oleae]|uniref:Coatomer subunit zeta n=1 Tax=Phytophthora oleae TaxID=2107226 RepID=A0ABD3G2W0_9STRA
MVKAASPSVKAIFILDSDGNRVCAKYYDKSYPTQKEQLALEKKLYAKTKNSNARLEADVILIENIVSVYRCGSDTTMHVVGSASENELILLTVLDSAFDAVSNLLKGRMDRHVMLDNIELVLLTFDEVVDGGIILEVDTPSISNRVLMRVWAFVLSSSFRCTGTNVDCLLQFTQGIDNEVPMAELTISQAFASAREQFSRSFRS